LSVFEEEVGKIVENTKNLIAQEDDPVEMLKVYITQHLLAMKKNRYLAEVIQIELRQTNKVIKTYRDNKFAEYLAIIAEIIRIGQKTDKYRADINPEVAKRIIFGSLDEVCRVWNASLESHYTVDEISEQVLLLVQSGLLKP